MKAYNQLFLLFAQNIINPLSLYFRNYCFEIIKAYLIVGSHGSKNEKNKAEKKMTNLNGSSENEASEE